MVRAIKAENAKPREINRLFLKRSISADYVSEDRTHHGLIIALRRRHGQLEGKLKSTGTWAKLKTVYVLSR